MSGAATTVRLGLTHQVVIPDWSYARGSCLANATQHSPHECSGPARTARRGPPCGRPVVRDGPVTKHDIRAVAAPGHVLHAPAMNVEFTGFLGDCLISGQLARPRERLTDQLNREQVLTLTNVVLEGLDGGRVESATFGIELPELCAAVATGPRGTRSLRIPTEARRLQAQIGPYAVLGRYHGPRGATSLRAFSGRDPMVPLTDATIAYVINGILEVRDAPVLIINRDLASWYRDADDPDAPISSSFLAAPAPAARVVSAAAVAADATESAADAVC